MLWPPNYLDVSQLPLPFHSVENQELFCLVVRRRKPSVGDGNHVTAVDVNVINRLRTMPSFSEPFLRQRDNALYVTR
jgi:hypothetical protein